MGFTNEAVMTVRRVTLDGQEYVLIPRRHWEAMTRRGSVVRGETTEDAAAFRGRLYARSRADFAGQQNARPA